jgi:hypothetical protein
LGGGVFNVVDNTDPFIGGYTAGAVPTNASATFSIDLGSQVGPDQDGALCSTVTNGPTPADQSFEVLVNGTEVIVNSVTCTGTADRTLVFVLAAPVATGQTVRTQVGPASFTDESGNAANATPFASIVVA